MRFVMIAVYLLLILVGVSFAALNAGSVQINLYITTLKLPVSIVMIITLGLGMLIGFLLFLGKYWRLKLNYFKTCNQLKINEKEIKNLRNIPLKDQH